GGGVLQTARRAASSVADGGQDGVGAAQLGQDLGRHRPRGVGLAPADELAHAVAALQDLGDEIVEALGADLAVVEQADHGSLERGERRRHAQRLAFGAQARVQDFQGHVSLLLSFTKERTMGHQAWIARVTASDFLPYQGGTMAPKPPAGPPAAMTRRSSGPRSAR